MKPMNNFQSVLLTMLFNKLTKLFSSVVSSRNTKLNVLIFGASKGGEAVYRSIQGKYKVNGFVDNNIQMQGGTLFNKKIYAPNELSNLSFDKLIIASNYHVEIYQQLSNEFGISKDLITVFDSAGTVDNSLFFRVGEALHQYIIDFLCNSSTAQSQLLFSYLPKITNRYNFFTLKKIMWLDRLDSHKVKTFREQMVNKSFAPHFIGEKQQIKSVITPDVSLYRFYKGGLMTMVNAVVFGNDNIAIGRVPSSSIKNSRYGGAYLSEHGNKSALVKKGQTHKVARGIAIIGSNDTNYYHWVIEVLSKLQFMSELPIEYENFPILLSEQALKIPSIKAYIKYLKISQSIIYLKSNLYYEVEDLLYISPTNYMVGNFKKGSVYGAENNFIRDESLEYLRGSLLSHLTKDNEIDMPSRVFLARKGVTRDYNQAEVFALVKAYGFEAVYLEDLTLLQQVSLMKNAKVIIGPTGAAWTNLIFCEPETLVLCWMAEEYGELACFSNLAQFSKVKMEYLSYKTGSQSARELYYKNYSVDIEEIKQWLDKNITQKH